MKLYDIKILFLRISKDIEDRFNKFVDKNKKYSKTSLINMALEGSYSETWKFIKKDNNSLKRFSNIYLLLKEENLI